MSEASRRSTAEPGRLATAAGALLLVVVGFAVGLVAGAAFEEPDLVIDQLAGRGERVPVEEVELPPGEAPLREPAAVAAPPPGASPEPDVSAAGPRAGYAIQVGAFADESAALKLASELDGLGLRGYVVEHGQGEARRWRVRVGPWPSEDEARRVAGRLKSERQLPTGVLEEPGR